MAVDNELLNGSRHLGAHRRHQDYQRNEASDQDHNDQQHDDGTLEGASAIAAAFLIAFESRISGTKVGSLVSSLVNRGGLGLGQVTITRRGLICSGSGDRGGGVGCGSGQAPGRGL